MPPKRAALDVAPDAGNRSKKTKTGNGKADKAAVATPDVDDIPRSKRWAKVSGSANIDMHYKTLTKDPAVAYSWVCICPASFIAGEVSDDEEEDEEDEDDDEGREGRDGSVPRCGTDSCVCNKSAWDHPGHAWVVSSAGLYKYRALQMHADLRDPDAFDMYTYNDHFGYGIMEVVQNLLVDFAEATEAGRIREQWAIVEGTALFLLSGSGGGSTGALAGVDDGDGVDKIARDVGRMALTALIALARAGLLAEDSEIKNIGFVMAMYVSVADLFHQMSVLEGEDFYKDDNDNDDDDDDDDGGDDGEPGGPFRFDSARFDSYILTYAREYGITLKGVADVDDSTAEVQGNMALPETSAVDPWDWASAVAEREDMGGDYYDLTSWTPAERKKASFDGKDPLGKKERDAIKAGLVMMKG